MIITHIRTSGYHLIIRNKDIQSIERIPDTSVFSFNGDTLRVVMTKEPSLVSGILIPNIIESEGLYTLLEPKKINISFEWKSNKPKSTAVTDTELLDEVYKALDKEQ